MGYRPLRLRELTTSTQASRICQDKVLDAFGIITFLHVLFLPLWGIVIMKNFSNIHRSIEDSQ